MSGSPPPRQDDAVRDALAGVRIVERSWLAWLAGRRFRSRRVAMVVGRSIHLTGATEAQFRSNAAWVAHELAHVEQFRRHGSLRFIVLYLIESLRRGYHANRFEVEARQAERGLTGARAVAPHRRGERG